MGMKAYGDISKKKIEVEHNFFNFIPLIRKTKIYLYLERPTEPDSSEYMKYIGREAQEDQIHPSNFNAFPDMLMSILLTL